MAAIRSDQNAHVIGVVQVSAVSRQFFLNGSAFQADINSNLRLKA